MNQHPALLMGFCQPGHGAGDVPATPSMVPSGMAVVAIDAYLRRIESLEKERDFLLQRIVDLETTLYRNSRDVVTRAKFDEESA